MVDAARLSAREAERQTGEASPPPAILPLIAALVDIMAREERARQKAETQGEPAS